MNRRKLIVLAGAVLAMAAACTEGDTSAAPTQTAPTQTAITPATTPAPTPDPSEPSPGHSHAEDMYQEVATQFGLPKRKIEEATIAARLKMLAAGGNEGEKLPAAHLDPSVLAVFADSLGAPAGQAESVMKGLIEEWEEYDEAAEEQQPGGYAKWHAYVAGQLKIPVGRAKWLGTLMISRPVLRVGDSRTGDDPIFDAIAKSLGVSTERLAEVVDGLKRG